MITTPRLTLRPFTLADLEAAIAGDEALRDHFGAPVATGWMEYPEALPYWREPLRASPDGLVWGMYGYFDRMDGTLVGGGGYKTPPSPDGVVEIGYGIAPSYRARGLATEAAQALTDYALAHPGVRTVVAHTLPEPNASNRLLQRCGFTFAGEVVDPDDGPVWRWVRHREDRVIEAGG